MSDSLSDTSETDLTLGYGWLGKDPNAPNILAGVYFDGSFPTRKEEYGFAHDRLNEIERGILYDAGTGYAPEIHVLPYIAAHLGWFVEAGDIDLRQFSMPFHYNIRRTFCNLGATPFHDNSADAVACISVLEHVSKENRELFLAEALRLLKPGGALIVTVDETEPEEIASWFRRVSFNVGERQPDPDEHLNPKVAYLAAVKQSRRD